MRPLFYTIMMKYSKYEQIDQYYPTTNVFGFSTIEKTEFGGVLLSQIWEMLHPNAPTFDINGHEAYVLYYYDELLIV